MSFCLEGPALSAGPNPGSRQDNPETDVPVVACKPRHHTPGMASSNRGNSMARNVDCTGKVVTKTPETIAAYDDRFHLLQVMADREALAGSDILDVIDWFCNQHHRWAASTVRQYRAALCQELDRTQIHPSRRPIFEARLSKGPEPKVGGPRKTSGKKRKSLPQDQFMTLIDALAESGKSDDLLIRGFLVFGAALFLRPVEYLGARVNGTTLIVQNAKATNGRANGSSRSRDIGPMGLKAIATLRTFLTKLREALAQAGCQKKLYNRLAARLARLCKVLGIARVSLYTLRHVGMATAKTWMSPIEVAAAAGHATSRTATCHYARRRTGWVLKMAGRPSPASIAAVTDSRKAFRLDSRLLAVTTAQDRNHNRMIAEPVDSQFCWSASEAPAVFAEIEEPSQMFAP